MFKESFPIISTPDLSRALTFYRDALDGRVTYRFPVQGEPVYVGLTVGASQLGLARDAAAQGGGLHASPCGCPPRIAMQPSSACVTTALTSSRRLPTSHGASGWRGCTIRMATCS